MKSAQTLNQSRKRKRVVNEPAPETQQSPVGELATRDMQTERTVAQQRLGETVHQSSLRQEQEKPAATDSLSPYNEKRGEKRL